MLGVLGFLASLWLLGELPASVWFLALLALVALVALVLVAWPVVVIATGAGLVLRWYLWRERRRAGL